MRRPTKLIAPLCAALVLACAGGVAAPALAASGGNAVINDCESSGQLSKHYTLAQLHHALAVMPASVKQYTDCYDVIARAVATYKTRSGSVTTGGGSGGSFLPTPVIIILVVLILAGVTFGAIAVRRRQSGGPSDPGDPGGPAPPAAG